MKAKLLILLLGLALGFALGFYRGKSSSDANWSKRAQLGASVDCFDGNGHLVPDSFAKYGGVRTGCGPGEVAKLHQAATH